MNKRTGTKRPRGTGARWAYEQIREMILSNELKPGSDLDEATLIKQLGLSRTPIREAIIQLTVEGLVEVLPNRGARVSHIDLTIVREFFEALNALQRMVTRWAAIRRRQSDISKIEECRLAFEDAVNADRVEEMTRLNADYHIAISEAAGNAFVAKTYVQLLRFGMRLSRIALVYEDGEKDSAEGKEQHITNIIHDHRQMTMAIISGDAELAERLAAEHVELFRKRVLGYLANSLSTDIVF
jgi:DNA-binding GntR family transcriptional regulator